MTCCLTRLTGPFSTLSGITSLAQSSSWVGSPALWCYDCSDLGGLPQQFWGEVRRIGIMSLMKKLKLAWKSRHFCDFCDRPSNPFGDFSSINFTIPESHYSLLLSQCHTVKVIYKSCNEIQKNMFGLRLRDVIHKWVVINKTSSISRSNGDIILRSIDTSFCCWFFWILLDDDICRLQFTMNNE